MVASNVGTGVNYVRMNSSSSINTNWTTNASTLNGGPNNRSGFNINIMLSVGKTSGLTNQPETAVYMMGDDEYLWLSNDAGATWRGRAGLDTIPQISVPYFCISENTSKTTPAAQRVDCAAKPILPGSDATALSKFDALGDLMADSKGNVIVSGGYAASGVNDNPYDIRDLHYQFILKEDSSVWTVQKFKDTGDTDSVGCFSFQSRYREGASSIRFRMGNENAILIVGGRPSNGTYGSAEDLSRYVLRAFERENYCKLGVPAVRKLNLKNF
jgi:hypothetical protein